MYRNKSNTNFARTQGNLASTPGTTSDTAIVAQVSDTVGKFGLQAYMTSCVQLDACLFLLFTALPNFLFQ